MKSKLSIPVYINYGRENFFKTHNLFKKFLKTVPYEKLQFQDNGNRSAGVIVSPRNNSGIPWCNITIALLYAYKNVPFKIILDDLNFLDPEWQDQLNAVEEIVEYICNNMNTSYLKTSAQADADLEDIDYKEIKRLSVINGIWNVRNVVPSEKLNHYIKLSYETLKTNAKKIKGLYATNIFDHCIHQSLVNNNGGLHKWFGWKCGTRIGCIDMSLGRGLVGIKDVPGYHCDLLDIIKNNMPEFMDSKENRLIAINEAIKEHTLRRNGKDSRAYQIVSTDKSDPAVEVDILIPVNILWDAASLGKNQFFETPLCWLHETIDFILTNTTAQVVVRQHPAEREFEIYGTGKKLGEFLQKKFRGDSRCKFISCNDNINTYLLIERCKVVLPYTSTVGIEAALMGKTVILESNVYYKDQPFVHKANSKKDYFEKIKKAYEEFGIAHQALAPNQSNETGWLLYFLLNKCSTVYSNFGLDPMDFEKWAPKGFDLLIRDENLMTAMEAVISNKPFAYLNGKKILKSLKEREKRVIEMPQRNNEKISSNLKKIISLINKTKFDQALRIMSEMPDSDDVYLYPKAFVLAKLNYYRDAEQALNRLNVLKPNHRYSQVLANEIIHKDKKSQNKKRHIKERKQVIGVISASYSGSTLLSAILGAHSSILAAGEVRWLIERNIFDLNKLIEGSKTLTKKQSVPWQDDAFKTVSYREVYNKIFEVFNINCIVDSSKEPKHFENIISNIPKNGVHFLFISLWKHPIRLLSSHLMHRWDKWEKLKNYNRNDAIRYLINNIYEKFLNINHFIKTIEQDYQYINLKYEQIVENIKSSVLPILDKINLDYEKEMEDYEKKEQYMLGGNSGPRFQIAKALNKIETKFENQIQEDFYKNINGVEMDNNYKKVFSEDEIKSIYENDKMKELLSAFKYNKIF